MSTAPNQSGLPPARPLRVRSVVGLAYDELRAMIVGGALAPGTRIGQGELADQLGISRGSVREALRRLAGDGLVEFEVNRGFFVAAFGVETILQRLEARLVLEPEIARLAAERRTDEDLDLLDLAVDAERGAGTAEAAHDASRTFHLAVARAAGNHAFVQILESLWLADVGRRLIAERRSASRWQSDDVAEHDEIRSAIEDRDGERAAGLMATHVESAFRHWSGSRRAT